MSRHTARPLVSLVVPALDEAENVVGLVSRYRALREQHSDYQFELVLVDDGSSDDTAARLIDSATSDDRVRVISLSRCFGSHYAISAGLALCEGECAIVLGADLQEPPELVDGFLAKWESGFDVVWGIRRTRTGRSRMNEWASLLFSWIFTRLAHLPQYPAEGPSGLLIDRVVIDEVTRLQERNRNILALVAWLGFRQARVEYQQRDRAHGQSRWTKRNMIELALDSIVQFSSTPLRISSAVGMAVASLGAIYSAVLILRWILGVQTPSGWPTVLVVILVLGGTQLAMMGIMGEYLWRGVDESRSRPLYVIRDVQCSDPQVVPQSPRRGIRHGDSDPPLAEGETT